MSDTPETDKLILDWYCNLTGLPNFVDIARKFERERDEARAHWGTESMNAAQFFGEKTKAIAERDEAREAMREAWLAMDELVDASERIIATNRIINWQNKHANIWEAAK